MVAKRRGTVRLLWRARVSRRPFLRLLARSYLLLHSGVKRGNQPTGLAPFRQVPRPANTDRRHPKRTLSALLLIRNISAVVPDASTSQVLVLI